MAQAAVPKILLDPSVGGQTSVYMSTTERAGPIVRPVDAPGASFPKGQLLLDCLSSQQNGAASRDTIAAFFAVNYPGQLVRPAPHGCPHSKIIIYNYLTDYREADQNHHWCLAVVQGSARGCLW